MTRFLSPLALKVIGVGLLLALIVFAINRAFVAHDLGQDLKAARAELAKCQKQAADVARKEADRYADREKEWSAQCAAAYDAGAQRVRDDKAVAAGRFVPGRSIKPARR